MGRLKQQMLEDEGRGYSMNSGLNVCHRHFGDEDLKRFVKANAQLCPCDFCDELDFKEEDWRDIKSVSVNQIIERVMIYVNRFYDDPANGLGYDSREGGYLGLNDIYYPGLELLTEGLEVDADYEVLEEIGKNMMDQPWTRNEFYGDSDSEHLTGLWEHFSFLVKHKVRHVFQSFEESSDARKMKESPSTILDYIGEYIEELGLVKQYPEKKGMFEFPLKIYRARQHKATEPVENAEQIGTPNPEYAGANRFSPEGIPMFYGADDIETAIEEVINRKNGDDQISIGEFRLTRPVNLLDLRRFKPVGYFDIERLDLLEPSYFLNRFIRSVSKKISDDDNHRIEYVPSQVVTEYIRYILPQHLNDNIDGIIYESTVNPGHNCYVFFAEAENCSDEKAEETKDPKKTLLFLLDASITKKVVRDCPELEAGESYLSFLK